MPQPAALRRAYAAKPAATTVSLNRGFPKDREIIAGHGGGSSSSSDRPRQKLDFRRIGKPIREPDDGRLGLHRGCPEPSRRSRDFNARIMSSIRTTAPFSSRRSSGASGTAHASEAHDASSSRFSAGSSLGSATTASGHIRLFVTCDRSSVRTSSRGKVSLKELEPVMCVPFIFNLPYHSLPACPGRLRLSIMVRRIMPPAAHPDGHGSGSAGCPGPAALPDACQPLSGAA